MRSSHSLAFCLLLASAAQAQDLNVITGVEVKDEGNLVVVTVKGSKPPNFTTFSMADPARFVIDLSESKFQGVPEDLRVDDGVVRVVKNLAYGSGATAIARVMIAFSADVEPPDVQTDGNTLLVRVVKPGAAAVATTGARPVETAKAAAPGPSDAGAGAASAAVAAAAAATAKAEADESARQEALAREQREVEAREQANRAAEATAREREAQARAEAEARAREAEQVAARQAAEEEAARAAADRRRAEIVAMAARQAEAAKEAENAKAAESAKVAEANPPQKLQEEAPAAAAATPAVTPPAAAAAAAPVATPPAGPTGAELAAAAESERQARVQAKADAKAKREIESALAAQQGTEARAPVAAVKPAKLQAIGFKQLPTVSRVFVKTSTTPRFTITDVGDDVVRLEVENTRSSRRNDTRPLDTSFFPSAVALITPSKQGTSYVVDIKLKKRVPYQQKVEGDLLAIDFERPAAEGSSPGGPAAVQPAGDAAQENDQGLIVAPEDKAEGEDQPRGAEPATGPAPKQ